MKAGQIDNLNIGLIIFSAILAFHYPLEIFIFSFAILGPLHYLTEINWLDKKDYFTMSSKRIWLWIGIVFSVIIVFPKLYFYMVESNESDLSAAITFINSWSNSLIFMSMILAVAFVFLKKKMYWIILLVAGAIGAFFLNTNDTYVTVIGLLVPTVIHVYFFTLIFMLCGAKKSKSKIGYLSVVIALLVPILFIGVDIAPGAYQFSIGMQDSYYQNNFHYTPILFAKFIGISDGKTFDMYGTMELRMMMFIAFIYLYHYLNWFSKTTIIQWHKSLTKLRSIAIVSIWILMMGIFYCDFRLGFIAALFFSLLHVILELPLNFMSIKGLFKRD
ncbi:MAG: hypothetical protein ACJA0U_001164 [Salibacteraceae bacterium]|jgi:hypothetical protein